jgi:hypothetical protein
MSTNPHERFTTADIAGQAPSPTEAETSQDLPPQDLPPNVRRIDAARAASTERPTALLPADEATGLRRQWETIQIGFVDEPRSAVKDADGLVAQAMKRVAEVFADERAQLERQWSEGQNVSTEDLRVALQRYRSFFDRLLAV